MPRYALLRADASAQLIGTSHPHLVQQKATQVMGMDTAGQRLRGLLEEGERGAAQHKKVGRKGPAIREDTKNGKELRCAGVVTKCLVFVLSVVGWLPARIGYYTCGGAFRETISPSAREHRS